MNFIKNKRILGLLVVILASMAYLQNVMAETITPTIDISQKSFGGEGQTVTYLDDTQFEEPTITIYEDAGKTINITNRFYISYRMQNGTLGTDKDKEVSIDPVTGTSVQTRYGEVTTGSKAGKATVIVDMKPIERYQGLYEATSCQYDIILDKVSPSAKRTCPSADLWQAAAKHTVVYPTFTISYEAKNGKVVDVTSHYDITATTNNQSLIQLDAANKRINTLDGEGKADITFHFATKDESTYAPIDDQTLSLNIKKLDKITPRLIFPEEGDSAYFATKGWHCLIPKVVDDFGNDLSWMTTPGGMGDKNGNLLLAWGAAPLAEGKTMHTPNATWSSTFAEQGYQDPEAGKVRQNGWAGVTIYAYNNLETGNPAYFEGKAKNEFTNYAEWDYWNTAEMTDYTTKIYCQVFPNPDKKIDGVNVADLYNASESYYNFKVMTRKSELVITPDPHYVTFTKGDQMTFNNRFEVMAKHVSTVDDPLFGLEKGDVTWLKHNIEARNQDVGMNYTVKFRSDEVRIDNFGGGDNYMKEVEEDGVKYTVLFSTKGWNNDNSWTMTFLKTGKINLQYAVYPYNHHWDGAGYSKQTITFNVIDKVQPKVIETPDPIVLYTTDKDLPAQPEVSITNQIGDDIKKYYDIRFEIEGEDAHGISEEKGIFKTGELTKGEVKVKVIATPKDSDIIFNGNTRPIKSVYDAGETEFTFIIKQLEAGMTRFGWDIIDTQSSNSSNPSADHKDHGKLYFTQEGVITAGYAIDAIPGLGVTLGKAGDDDWQATKDENGRIYVWGDAVTLDKKGLPTSGTYYELKPHTNGFLTVDAHYMKGNKITIIASNAKDKQSYTPSADFTGELGDAKWKYAEDEETGYPHNSEYTYYRYPLLAGKTYYLYNEGDSKTYEPLQVYGINFLPAFINQSTDHTPITTATAFANGYAGALPTLTDKSKEGYKSVAYHKVGNLAQGASQDIEEYAELDEKLGTIKPSKGTVTRMNKGNGNVSIANHKALSTAKDRIKIYAVVKSNYKPNVVKTPFYDLMISDIPTFVVPDGYIPTVGETVSTTNYKTKLKAYFGGWKKADNRPYYKNNKPQEGVVLTDSWKISKLDSVGASNRTVDYFTYSSFGGQNATTEMVKAYKYDVADEDMTYQVPCRGSYIRFEPEEKGTLVVYVLQNGMIIYDGDKEKLANTSKEYDKIKMSPVFITDETGLPVKLQPWSISQYDAAAKGTEAYTEGIINCDYDTWKKDCNKGEECGLSNMSTKNETEQKYTLELLKRISYVSPNSPYKMGDTEKVIDIAKELGETEGSMGYTVISKAYTRYSFKVEAGKTYFVFMNGSKLGNGGFAFMPENWTPDRKDDANEVQEVTLDEEGNDDLSNRKIESGKTAKVKLYHKFAAKRWNSLCVPFSINQSQFKKIFGENALAISFDEFQKKDTINGEVIDNVAHFTQHSYHWIVAGRPYLILPDETFKAQIDENNNGRQYITVDSVTFEKVEAPMHLMEQKAKADFNFNGNYEPTTLYKGDYAIASKANGEAMLYELPKNMSQKGYRAYIRTTPAAVANNTKINTFSCGEITEGGNNETTAIEPIFALPEGNDSGTTFEGVYDLNGVKIGTSVEDMKQRQENIYIVNGKKVLNKK